VALPVERVGQLLARDRAAGDEHVAEPLPGGELPPRVRAHGLFPSLVDARVADLVTQHEVIVEGRGPCGSPGDLVLRLAVSTVEPLRAGEVLQGVLPTGARERCRHPVEVGVDHRQVRVDGVVDGDPAVTGVV